MANPQWVIDLFGSIDSMDSDKFASFLSDDCVFTFGNADSVIGSQGRYNINRINWLKNQFLNINKFFL